MKVRFKDPLQFGVMNVNGEDVYINHPNNLGIPNYLLTNEFDMRLNTESPFQLVDVYLEKYNQWLSVYKEFITFVKD